MFIMRKDPRMIPIKTSLQLAIIAKMAKDMWTECYSEIYPKKQLTYMIKNQQSYDVIKHQIEDGYFYYSTNVKCQPVGYFCAKPQEDGMLLNHLYIQPEHRKTGIAKEVISFVEELARNNQQKKIYLRCNSENTDAIAAFEALGFSVEEDVKTDLGSGYISNDVIMTKPVVPRKFK